MAESQLTLFMMTLLALSTLTTSVLNFLDKRHARRREQKLQETADDTHTLVNSQRGAYLLTGLVSARALAHAVPTPANKQLLSTAQREWDEYARNQAIVDERQKERWQ